MIVFGVAYVAKHNIWLNDQKLWTSPVCRLFSNTKLDTNVHNLQLSPTLTMEEGVEFAGFVSGRGCCNEELHER